MQHWPKVKLMPKCLGLKLSNDTSGVCVAAVLRELQMMHVSTEHKQRVWTKWPVLPCTLIFIQSGVNKFNCWDFKFFTDVNRICVAAVLRKFWCLKVVYADFWIAPKNVGGLWAHPQQESWGPYPWRGGRGSQALLLAKKIAFHYWKSDLKMRFFVSQAGVCSLLHCTVYHDTVHNIFARPWAALTFLYGPTPISHPKWWTWTRQRSIWITW